MSGVIGEAFVRIRPDDSTFRRETTAQVSRDVRAVERSVAGSNREIARFSRGALVGTGVLGGLGRAAAFASGAFIGGAGLTYALKSTLDAAMESQRVLAQTQNAVTRSGLSWQNYGEQVKSAALETANLSGFDDERLLETFSRLVRRTGDVNESLRLNALAADVARGANIELESAAKLVLRASVGQARGLAIVGIHAEQGATAVQLLNEISRKYAGSAAAYGETAAGAQDRFNVALENTQEVIGTAVLPSLTELLDKATEWLNDTENQKRIQDGLNDTMRVAGGVAHDLALAYDTVHVSISKVSEFNVAGKNPFGWAKELAKQLPGVKEVDHLAGLIQKVADLKPNPGWANFFNAITGLKFAPLTDLEAQRGNRELDRLASQPLLKGTAIVGRKLNEVEALQAAVDAASLTPGTADDVAALKAQRDERQRVRDYALKMIREERGNTAKFNKEASAIAGQIASINSQLASIDAENAAAAERAADAAEKAANKAIIAARRHLRATIRASFGAFGIAGGALAVAGDLIVPKAERDLAAKLRKRLSQNKQLGIKGGFLGGIDFSELSDIGSLREQIAAATGDKALLKFEREVLAAAQTRLQLAQKLGGTEKQILEATLLVATTKQKIRDLKKRDKAADAFSIQDLFAEGGNQFAQYGSNVGALVQPLSRGEAGGATVRAAKQIVVNQHFYGERNAAQAIAEASQAARALK